MRRFLLALFVLTISAGSLLAQESAFRFVNEPFAEENRVEANADDEGSSSEYRSSYADGTDTKSLVQKNAIFRADQRRRRIASRKWFGYSNSRPIVAAGPYMTAYSPAWAGNPWTSYYWYGSYWR